MLLKTEKQRYKDDWDKPLLSHCLQYNGGVEKKNKQTRLGVKMKTKYMVYRWSVHEEVVLRRSQGTKPELDLEALTVAKGWTSGKKKQKN